MLLFWKCAKAGSALVCFDPTKMDTWQKLDFWVGELQENEPRCKIYLVETKRKLNLLFVQVLSYCLRSTVLDFVFALMRLIG